METARTETVVVATAPTRTVTSIASENTIIPLFIEVPG
jgi:hypothetical protein